MTTAFDVDSTFDLREYVLVIAMCVFLRREDFFLIELQNQQIIFEHM